MVQGDHASIGREVSDREVACARIQRQGACATGQVGNDFVTCSQRIDASACTIGQQCHRFVTRTQGHTAQRGAIVKVMVLVWLLAVSVVTAASTVTAPVWLTPNTKVSIPLQGCGCAVQVNTARVVVDVQHVCARATNQGISSSQACRVGERVNNCTTCDRLVSCYPTVEGVGEIAEGVFFRRQPRLSRWLHR